MQPAYRFRIHQRVELVIDVYPDGDVVIESPDEPHLCVVSTDTQAALAQVPVALDYIRETVGGSARG